MATIEISELATETTIDTANDYLMLVDVSETPDAINKVTPASLYTAMTGNVKRYVALLTQTSTNAPVATVLENSLGGTVVWSYSDVGTYTATLASAFPENKTLITLGITVTGILYGAYRNNANSIEVSTTDLAGDPANDTLLETAFVVTVYP